MRGLQVIPNSNQRPLLRRAGPDQGADDRIAARYARALLPSADAEPPCGKSGLSALQSGGDFADGVIAYDGPWLDGEIFVSFDK